MWTTELVAFFAGLEQKKIEFSLPGFYPFLLVYQQGDREGSLDYMMFGARHWFLNRCLAVYAHSLGVRIYVCFLFYHQLQQFRQKKEVKSSVSHGKSSKKYGKAEQADADASSTNLIPTVPPEVTEKETPRADSHTEISDSPVLHSMGAGEPDMSSTQLREDQVTDIGCALLLLILLVV